MGLLAKMSGFHGFCSGFDKLGVFLNIENRLSNMEKFSLLENDSSSFSTLVVSSISDALNTQDSDLCCEATGLDLRLVVGF
jgi:hypothetical protein